MASEKNRASVRCPVSQKENLLETHFRRIVIETCRLLIQNDRNFTKQPKQNKTVQLPEGRREDPPSVVSSSREETHRRWRAARSDVEPRPSEAELRFRHRARIFFAGRGFFDVPRRTGAGALVLRARDVGLSASSSVAGREGQPQRRPSLASRWPLAPS